MKSDRFAELDALRGIAAMMVVVFHFAVRAEADGRPLFGFDFGKHGVQLFFCVSGFVIYWTLERSRTLMDFAVSRFSRLYPAYWTAILLLFGVTFISADEPRWWLGGYLANATMLQRFVGMPDLDIVYWTLAVELMFYVWMAAIYRVGVLKHIVPISMVWLIVAAVIGWQYGTRAPEPVKALLIYEHIPYFIAGMMFYILRKEGFSWQRVGVIAAAWVTVAVIEGPDDVVVPTVVFGIFTLAVTGSLRWLVNPATVWLGTISYSLYLTHRALAQKVMVGLTNEGMHQWLAFLVAIAAAVLIASLITLLIERPAMSLIRTAYQRIRTPAAIATPA